VTISLAPRWIEALRKFTAALAEKEGRTYSMGEAVERLLNEVAVRGFVEVLRSEPQASSASERPSRAADPKAGVEYGKLMKGGAK
jgi:hypothetical protein